MFSKSLLSTAIYLLFILHSCSAKAKDKEANSSGVTVKVLGQSGKISVRRSTGDGKEKVVIEMDEIAEIAADNNTKVGTSGSSKHSFNSFANQDFVFTDLTKRDYQNISANAFDFKANVSVAYLVVTVTIFNKGGTIVNGDEEFDVKKGTVKTDISIENWSFCNPCKKGGKDEFGAFLDFTMTIKGKDDGPKKKSGKKPSGHRKRAPSYDLGEDVELIISKKYNADGVLKDMPTDYPKLVAKGSKKSFVFRFAKFSNKVSYDPSITTEEDSSAGGSSTKVSFSSVCILLCSLILSRLF